MKLRVLTALGMALLAAALVLQYRPNAWEPRVTEELLHAPSNHWPRPTLAEAGQGHFGTLVDADWATLGTLGDNWGSIPLEVRVECLKATADLDLESHFRSPCRQWLEAARRHLPTLERAVASAEAGPPDRFDPLRGHDSGHALRLAVLGRIPALETLAREAAARDAAAHDHALDACVTTLEVIRDSEWGLRSTDFEVGEGAAKSVFFPCAHALLNASAPRRARFAEQLQKVRDGRPPLAHGFSLWRSTELLHWYGPTLPKKTLERADPKVKEWILRNDASVPLKSLRASWEDLSRYYDGLVEAARQPPERRRLAMNVHRWAWDEQAFKDDPAQLEAWSSVDAVFDGLKVVAALADQTAAAGGWPEPLPRGEQTRLSRSGAAVSVLLDLRTVPVALNDGGVAALPNQWQLELPELTPPTRSTPDGR